MSSNDRKRAFLRLAYYACAVYAVSLALLLNWRMDEPLLGYDPNHDGRSFRIFILLVLAGLSVYGARIVNFNRDEAMDAMLRRFGIKPIIYSEDYVVRVRYWQVVGALVMCSFVFFAR